MIPPLPEGARRIARGLLAIVYVALPLWVVAGALAAAGSVSRDNLDAQALADGAGVVSLALFRIWIAALVALGATVVVAWASTAGD